MNSIVISKIQKRFNRKTIFQDVSFDVTAGDVFGIIGRNGSGKSTLLKIIAGVLAPSNGSVEYRLRDRTVASEYVFQSMGFLSPYLQLFDEFSAFENIRLFARIRNISLSTLKIEGLLDRVGLPKERKDPIRGYSSGMKQRMKVIFAILHEPKFLLLDEPTTNLDSDGTAMVYSIVEEFRKQGCVLIATNDRSDIDQCNAFFNLNTGQLESA